MEELPTDVLNCQLNKLLQTGLEQGSDASSHVTVQQREAALGSKGLCAISVACRIGVTPFSFGAGAVLPKNSAAAEQEKG